ncbi:MAG TPA: hypothetical protein PLR50_09780, partial [Candidatus Rifleibacterium sp.]|nr:hypothetical protein [Candidatus Rifleibacterium sp.]
PVATAHNGGVTLMYPVVKTVVLRGATIPVLGDTIAEAGLPPGGDIATVSPSLSKMHQTIRDIMNR